MALSGLPFYLSALLQWMTMDQSPSVCRRYYPIFLSSFPPQIPAAIGFLSVLLNGRLTKHAKSQRKILEMLI